MKQPAPPRAMAATQPPLHVSPAGMWLSKLSLRIASSIFCLVLVGITLSLGVTWAMVPLICYVPPAGVALVWNVAECICLGVRGGHRGIHPGAVVGVDLLLWLGYLASTLLLGLLGFAAAGDYDAYYSYASDYYGRQEARLTQSRVCIAFGALEILLHFALFVVACYETNVRNTRPRVIYIETPHAMVLPPGMAVYGYVPQVYYPQQMQYAQPQGQPPEGPLPMSEKSPVQASH